MVKILYPNLKNIIKASKAIRQGKIIVFPTETVYGLGADATNDKAVANIYKIKNRPINNPLIVHTSNLEEAYKYGIFDDRAKKIAEKFWPGPISIIVKRQLNTLLSKIVSAKSNTVAIRIPSHPTAYKLLKLSNVPIAAPSANMSGGITTTLPKHITQNLKNKIHILLDDGPCLIGIESSVILAFPNKPIKIVRPGSITPNDLKEFNNKLFIKNKILRSTNSKLISPGLLSNHYAPKVILRINVNNISENEVYLAFGKKILNSKCTLNLSKKSSLIEAAKNLFAMLHHLDEYCIKNNLTIAVAPIPNYSLGIAINDRLLRASALR